jgi:hypothetical protein
MDNVTLLGNDWPEVNRIAGIEEEFDWNVRQIQSNRG